MSDQLLHTIDGAALTLGISRSQTYKLHGQGAFEVVHIGRRAYVTDESLRAFVARLRAVEGGTLGGAA